MERRRVASAALLVTATMVLSSGIAAAQPPAIVQAQQLQQRGDLAGARILLEAHLAAHPEDGEAAGLLAQTLYWLRAFAEARAQYEAALNRHPDDATLRLNYARMLGETGDRRRARAQLALLTDGPRRADAYGLLGTLAYWDGDLNAAARAFEQALAWQPGLVEAVRQLHDIRLATAPWIRIAPRAWHDDQPLDRRGAELDAGFFPAPLTSVRLRVEGARYTAGGTSFNAWTTEGELTHYAAAAHLDAAVAGGFLRRGVGDDRPPEWIGRGTLGVRLPAHLAVRGRVEHAPYLHSIASLTTRLAAETFAGELHWDHPRGWTGRAAVQTQRFPDDNATYARYAWLLAPLHRSSRADLQGGYSIAYEDADESRFVPAAPAPAGRTAPGDATPSTVGEYAPYYTPEHLLRQAAIAALTARAPRATIRLGGSIPLRASEDVPLLYVSDGTVVRTFSRRTFRPWDARASAEVAIAGELTLTLSAEFGRSAFYRSASAGAHLTYRFVRGRRTPPTP